MKFIPAVTHFRGSQWRSEPHLIQHKTGHWHVGYVVKRWHEADPRLHRFEAGFDKAGPYWHRRGAQSAFHHRDIIEVMPIPTDTVRWMMVQDDSGTFWIIWPSKIKAFYKFIEAGRDPVGPWCRKVGDDPAMISFIQPSEEF